MLVVNGWQIFAHPLFLDQIERLTAAVEGAKAKHPEGFQKSANAYRQGGTLGANRKHWFRAKFGGQPFRLFFRYDSAVKIILFAWVNDADTSRTYGAKTDASAVLRSMLDKDAPPDDWRSLVKESAAPEAAARLDNIIKPSPYRSK